MRGVCCNCRYEKQGRKKIASPHCWLCLCCCGGVSSVCHGHPALLQSSVSFWMLFQWLSVFCGKDWPAVKYIFFWFCVWFQDEITEAERLAEHIKENTIQLQYKIQMLKNQLEDDEKEARKVFLINTCVLL